MNKQNQLTDIHKSWKPYIIYKSQNGFNLYTDFSKKILLNEKNVYKFLNKKQKKTFKQTDLFVGFFGYELLNNLIGIKLPKQKKINFPKGIFYKPEKIISFSNTLRYRNRDNNKKNKSFKINIDRKSYSIIFNKFKKKIKSGETYQIKICTKYKTFSKIDPLDFFCRLSETNLAPEAFLIRDKNYSIISCSPENLITKKGPSISTKPIAGTVKKDKSMNKNKALKYFRENLKETKEHNMIVDMERNDLSKICKTGSVKIEKLKRVEEYRDLFHYVSTIKGLIKKNITNHEIISSLMPGGSVIGCPKISTIQLLNNKEKNDRNIYTGSFGVIHSNGDMRFNIMIRTLLNFKNYINLSVASGAILGSTAKKEYNENYIKAKSLLELFH